MSTAFQASFICKPPSLSHNRFRPCRLRYFTDNSLNLSKLNSRNLYPISIRSRDCRHSAFLISCTLHSDSVPSFSSDKNGLHSDSEKQEFSNDVSSGEVLGSEFASVSIEDTNANADLGKEEGKSGEENEVVKSKLPVVAFMTDQYANAKKDFDKFIESILYHWFPPLLPEEKRLMRMLAEADENPKDAAKQSALLAELNKLRYQSTVFGLI